MPWRAAYCEPRREFFARDNLLACGFDVFLPYERVTRREKLQRFRHTAYQVKQREEPLFPRYLFVDSITALAVSAVRGIVDVVKNGAGVPLSLPPGVIDELRAMTDENGLFGQRDHSRLSHTFAGRIGDQFTFKKNSALHGLLGYIVSLDRLDEAGEIRAWVAMLGGARDVRLKHHDIDQISRMGQVIRPAEELVAA